MARTEHLTCDICKRETKRIVGKLFFTPTHGGQSNSFHSRYTHHCDVGVCCEQKMFNAFGFRARMTAEEYRESRRAS